MTVKEIGRKIIVFLLLAIVACGIFPPARSFASAANVSYSSVMDDLKKDESFKESDYPADAKDASIQVIQIAESTDGELFVYTYQPCQKTRYLVATEINMSLTESVEGTDTYALRLVSTSGVLCKYVVKNFKVSASVERYYNITSIYRDWIEGIDQEAGNDNTVNGAAFKVGQIWTVTTSAEGTKYEMKAVDVVTVTKEMIGFKRYNDGFQFSGTKSCDAHFLAFSCDHAIDRIRNADVKFNTQSYRALAGSGTTYGEPVTHKVTLYDYQVASSDGSGWFGKKEEWHRILPVNEFLKETEFTSQEKLVLSNYDWVLNFYETDYICEAGGKDVLISALVPFGFVWTIVNACTTTGEIVSEVSLLRLEFDYNDEIYNLGVVSQKQTGSNVPFGEENNGFWNWLTDFFQRMGQNQLKWYEWFIFAGMVVVALLALGIVFFVVKWLVRIFKFLFSTRSRKE